MNGWWRKIGVLRARRGQAVADRGRIVAKILLMKKEKTTWLGGKVTLFNEAAC